MSAELHALERAHGDDCSCQRCTGFEAGNEAHLLHGATSERHIQPLARNHRRRVLRQMRLRASELSPTGRALLEHYCRLVAKVVLLDAYFDEAGFLREDGTPQPSAKLYVQLHRAALNALGRLETHLDAKAPSLEEQLAELRRSG